VDPLREKKGAMGADLAEVTMQPTGQVCADCGDDIRFTEEAWLLQVVQLQKVGGQLQYAPVIDETDPSRDFLYSPYFFCFRCWESQYDELKEELDNQPPNEDPLSVAECTCCGSSVREGEYTGLFIIGEFHTSRRSPNGVPSGTFAPNAAPEVLCFYCLYILNDNFIEMWEEVSQFGECEDCIFCRCWRGASCSCSCHQPDTEELTTTETP
jgi:hypothetical protein